MAPKIGNSVSDFSLNRKEQMQINRGKVMNEEERR